MNLDASDWRSAYFRLADAVCRESTSVEDACQKARATRSALAAATARADRAEEALRAAEQAQRAAEAALARVLAEMRCAHGVAYGLTTDCAACLDAALKAPKGDAAAGGPAAQGGGDAA